MSKMMLRVFLTLSIALGVASSYASEEELFSVDLSNQNKQAGLYVASSKTATPTKLIVIVPGFFVIGMAMHWVRRCV